MFDICVSIKSIINVILGCLRLLYIGFQQVFGYPAVATLLVLILPVKTFNPLLFKRLYNIFAHTLILLGTWYTWSAGYGVLEVGDDISACHDENTLVLINHQSVSDLLFMFPFFTSRTDFIYKSMFIMNEEFKYTPFGIMCSIKKHFFIPIGKERRAQGLAAYKKHLEKWFFNSEIRQLLMFPEGGFLYKRKEKSKKYALEHNLPVLENVCLPRLGAIQTTLDVCNSANQKSNGTDGTADSNAQLKWVLDITIAYPGGKPLWVKDIALASRPPCNVTLLYRLYPASQLTLGPDQVTRWVYDRWQEKDQILATFYATGSIPVDEICDNPTRPRLLVPNPIKLYTIQLVFYLYSYWFYKVFALYFDLSIFLWMALAYAVFIALKVTKQI